MSKRFPILTINGMEVFQDRADDGPEVAIINNEQMNDERDAIEGEYDVVQGTETPGIPVPLAGGFKQVVE